VHRHRYEVRLKAEPGVFAGRLQALGCLVDYRDDLLLVQVPDGETQQMIWRAAAENREQIRSLRPQRSTLEEVFLKAVEHA
jgi:ABC-2 type transport system ATP-binding protein